MPGTEPEHGSARRLLEVADLAVGGFDHGVDGLVQCVVLHLELLDLGIGLVGLDAGTWAFHCHIQEHADAGMMTLVEVSERT